MPLDLLAVARDVIAIDSRSSVSDRPLVDLLLPLCRAAGLEASLQDELRDGERQYNLVCRRPGLGLEPALLLNTHLDTVPPGDPQLWAACRGRPFELAQRDGLLYGLGVADVKLDLVCKLLALERLRAEPLQRQVVLAGTYGEETGRWGAKLLARSLQPCPAMALVGEPTGLRPCLAHKGYVEVRVHATGAEGRRSGAPCWRLAFEGVAAHSSQPHQGSSANDRCLDALTLLSRRPGFGLVSIDGGDLVNRVAAHAEAVITLDDQPDLGVTPSTIVTPGSGACGACAPPELVALLLAVHSSTKLLRTRLEAHATPGFDPPWSTVNNGLVRLAGGRLTHVADVRRLPGDGPQSALEAHLARLQDAAAASAVDVTVEKALDSPPFSSPPGSAVAAALSAVLGARGMSLTPELKSGTTEASVYADAGMDAVVFGPGQAAGNIHRPDECVPLAELDAAVEIYEAVVRRLCSA